MSFTTKLMYVYFSHYVFFTFSNISKTLIICSIKRKPSTRSNKFIVYTMRNTDHGGTGLAFASITINVIRGFLHWLFLIRCKNPWPDLSRKRTDHFSSFKMAMIMNYSQWPEWEVCRSDLSELGLIGEHSGQRVKQEKVHRDFWTVF